MFNNYTSSIDYKMALAKIMVAHLTPAIDTLINVYTEVLIARIQTIAKLTFDAEVKRQMHESISPVKLEIYNDLIVEVKENIFTGFYDDLAEKAYNATIKGKLDPYFQMGIKISWIQSFDDISDFLARGLNKIATIILQNIGIAAHVAKKDFDQLWMREYESDAAKNIKKVLLNSLTHFNHL